MNIIKKLLPAAFGLIAAFSVQAQAPELKPEVFDLLDLDYPGLEKVKEFHSQGNESGAAAALLDYYRGRKGICTPDINDVNNVQITKEQQKWADDALNHTFFVHKGYQPSYNYGEDIDWKYWPVQDNELRWQLHRHKWFAPMGRAYRVSGDEKYAVEWTRQYIDWIRKNPLVKVSKNDYEMKGEVSSGALVPIDGKTPEEIRADAENARFAWRPLEVSHRLQDQTVQFQLFVDSPAFTPEFLTEFLVNYEKHADHIMHNWSKQGNHLLFEAQRMLAAGSFFPEFKDASAWRKSGIEILNKEINVQVYDDGGHYELCPHYHLASIQIFMKSLQVADLGGFRNDFPQSYIDTMEKMIEFYTNIIFPDYTNPCFSDAKITTKEEVICQYKDWSRLFPENQTIRYFATDGREGALPEYLSKGFETSGFFVFRNGWGKDAMQMVVKAGPPGEWHCQPDNGTFELWYNGKNLFPDSGSYVYAGSKEIMEWRNRFRRTAMHNTLVLDGRNLETTDSRTLLWKPEGDVQILVTENQSYKNLTHRRSIFFVDNSYFVIVDEAAGSGKGNVELHYQLPAGNVPGNSEDMHFHTEFEAGSNMKLQCFGPDAMTMRTEEGWYSTAYMKKTERTNACFNVKKEDETPVRYITVIVPKKESGDNPAISAKFKDKGYSDKGMSIEVKVGKSKKKLSYTL